MGAEEEVNPDQEATYERTPSSFDRTIEPPYGKAPEVKVPEVWEQELASGMEVYGITNKEVPLVQFSYEHRRRNVAGRSIKNWSFQSVGQIC